MRHRRSKRPTPFTLADLVHMERFIMAKPEDAPGQQKVCHDRASDRARFAEASDASRMERR